LKEGAERACDGCNEIFKFYEFPFNSINLCFRCWEIKHNKTLHDKRFRKLARVIEARSFKKFGANFNYDELINKFDEHQSYNTLINKKSKKQVGKQSQIEIIKKFVPNKIKERDAFRRENTLEDIIYYLKKQKANNAPLRFWYRSDIEPRNIRNYFINEKYLNVRSEKGYYIKFLIDKIRKI